MNRTRSTAGILAGELLAGSAPLILLLLAWQLFYAVLPSNTFLRGPGEALAFLADPDNAAAVARAVGSTLLMVAIGYVIALAVALALACIVTASDFWGRAVTPLALVLGVVPVVVITPVVIMLFGRGPGTSIAVCVLITFFSCFVSLVSGMRGASRTLIDLSGVLGGGAVRTVLFVRLPSAVPSLLSASKLALPAAISGVLLTEYIATGAGLGTFINYARANYRYIDMWAGILVLIVIATLLYVLIGAVEAVAEERFGIERVRARKRRRVVAPIAVGEATS